MATALLAGAVVAEHPASAQQDERTIPGAAASDAVIAVDGRSEIKADLRGGWATTRLAAGRVAIPADADLGMSLAGDGMPAVTVGIPGSGSAEGVESAAGVVYEHAVRSTDVVVRPTEEGVQAMAVIGGPTAPTTFVFPVAVGGVGAVLAKGQGGAIEIRQHPGGAPLALIQPPWAIDAAGRSVPTTYEIRGSSVVQKVEHRGHAYPVVADPNTCGWVTCTYYFGKKATRDVSAAKNAVAGCSFLYAMPLGAALCAVSWAAISIQADRAQARKMCLKIKYVKVQPGPWYPDIYSGGSCR